MDSKPFVELLRRLTKSKFKEFVMVNRMCMQCYDIDEDSDIGQHYILHIPQHGEYEDSFYDETLILNPAAILPVYAAGHDKLTEERKKAKAKPKDVKETFDFVTGHKHAKIKFQFILADELIATETYQMDYPVNENDHMVENVASTYLNMLDRIRVGGAAVQLDGIRMGLMDIALDSPEIFYYTIKMRGVKVRIPLYKSLFMGQKTFDEFFISVQETNLPLVYLYTAQFARKGIIEQLIGYIQSF